MKAATVLGILIDNCKNFSVQRLQGWVCRSKMGTSSVLHPPQPVQTHWILQLLRRNSETIVEFTGITQDKVS